VDVATDLPRRRGERPRTTSEFPHSQIDQQPADPGVLDELARRAFGLGRVIERPSIVSVPGARALVLADDGPAGPATAFIREREFAHFHPGPDWSLHLALPDSTADLAIDRGWAELHLVARTPDFPGSVVMVYAPRDRAEADVVWSLLRASHAFASAEPEPNAPAGEVLP
jgi:hypothetical protein